MFKLAKWVDWPADAAPPDNAPFTFGILGADPFGPQLDQVLCTKTIETHPIKIKRFARVEDVCGVQVLFISRSDREQLDRIREKLGNKPILTVSDIDDFARRGGIVRLYLEEGKARFQVNLNAAKHAGLKISSHVLSLAQIYEE